MTLKHSKLNELTGGNLVCYYASLRSVQGVVLCAKKHKSIFANLPLFNG